MIRARHLAAYSALLAVALVALQYGVLRLTPYELAARIVLPATVAAIPFALWSQRRRLGVWIAFVGIAANLSAILANGGLMPITRATVVDAVGEERAGRYETGSWIKGSKDVLVAPGGGRLRPLGDSIVVRLGGAGFVASPGDIVVWAGLIVFAADLAIGVQLRRASPVATSPDVAAEQAGRAQGGAAT